MAWQKALAKYPKAYIHPHVAGYDTDPRELWQIPEVCDYLCHWARFAGLDHSSAFGALPNADHARDYLVPHLLAFLAKCGAVKDIDPDRIRVGRDDGSSDSGGGLLPGL